MSLPSWISDPCPHCSSVVFHFGNAPVSGQQTVICDGCQRVKGVYVKQLVEGQQATPFRDPAPLQSAKGFRIGI